MEKDARKKEYMRQYYQTHKERFRENCRAWRKANPDKVRESNHIQYERRKALKQGKKKGESAGSVEQCGSA